MRAFGFLRTNRSFVPGNQNFQQNALTYGDADNPNSWTSGTVAEGERYVYVYRTPSGRKGSAYLARVAESDLTDLDEYEYWSGEDNGGWVKGDPSAATSVIGGGNSNFQSFLPTTGFLGQINAPALGTAQSGMYAPMIHPWSGIDRWGDGDERYLYYNVSSWDAHNVALTQTDLAPLKAPYV